MFHQLTAAFHVLRPRSLARASKSIDDLRQDLVGVQNELRELRRSLKYLKEREADLSSKQETGLAAVDARVASAARAHADRLDSIAAEVRAIGQDLAAVHRREAQLHAIARRDAELEVKLQALDHLLDDCAIACHVRAAVGAASLHLHPLPYAVVDNLLPDAVYDALLTAIPPAEQFAVKRAAREQLSVPLEIGPVYARRVWRYMTKTITRLIVAPLVIEKFRAPMTAWLKENFPELGDDPVGRLELTTSQGRILLRHRGYHIPPHRDPKWGFLTCILYLAKPGDDLRWGTQLFEVQEDCEARSAQPHWIDPARCRKVEDVQFCPNRLLVFLNSVGAHGAQIPEDSQPHDLERYIYQFRIGAGNSEIGRLISTLPPDRRPFWAGKLLDEY